MATITNLTITDLTATNITTTGRFHQKKGSNVASASLMTLPNDGNVFLVTGTHDIEAIAKEGWENGDIIYLIFDDQCGLLHNSLNDPNYPSLFFQTIQSSSSQPDQTLGFVLDLDDNYWRCLEFNM